MYATHAISDSVNLPTEGRFTMLTEQRTLRVKSGDTCEIWDTKGTTTLDTGAQFTGTKVLALLVQVDAS